MLRTVILFIEIITAYLIQSSVFPYFSLAGVVPDILLILVVSCAFFYGQRTGIVVGFLSGLLMDFCIGDVVGAFAIFYSVIGFFNGYAKKIYDREDFLLPMGLICISEIVYNFMYYVAFVLLRGKLDFLFFLRKIILPRVIYTVLAAILFYRIYQLIYHGISKLTDREY